MQNESNKPRSPTICDSFLYDLDITHAAYIGLMPHKTHAVFDSCYTSIVDATVANHSFLPENSNYAQDINDKRTAASFSNLRAILCYFMVFILLFICCS